MGDGGVPVGVGDGEVPVGVGDGGVPVGVGDRVGVISQPVKRIIDIDTRVVIIRFEFIDNIP